jgi:suppressor for copper-sensitivity B
VFIDVTADWCVTCKANKYNVLLRDDVQQALFSARRGRPARRLEPPSATLASF